MKPQITLSPLTGAIAAEVSGVDLNGSLADATVEEIRKACLDHCVLLFRGQKLEPASQVALTKRLGTALVIPYLKSFWLPGYPEIVVVRNLGKANSVTEEWHSESSFFPVPPGYTVLVARELPEFGGDTMFANQYLAYETLSPTMQRVISGLRAIHRAAGDDSGRPGESHPVEVTHPETGRKALYVNRAYTCRFEGLTEAEGNGLLEFLLQHSSRPDFVYRHRWTRGDVLVWDNRPILHYAVHDYGKAQRVMYRTITGEPLGILKLDGA